MWIRNVNNPQSLYPADLYNFFTTTILFFDNFFWKIPPQLLRNSFMGNLNFETPTRQGFPFQNHWKPFAALYFKEIID
jgi:hypothetical protein